MLQCSRFEWNINVWMWNCGIDGVYSYSYSCTAQKPTHMRHATCTYKTRGVYWCWMTTAHDRAHCMEPFLIKKELRALFTIPSPSPSHNTWWKLKHHIVVCDRRWTLHCTLTQTHTYPPISHVSILSWQSTLLLFTVSLHNETGKRGGFSVRWETKFFAYNSRINKSSNA